MPARQSPGPPTGRGNATITTDGCPVEIYAASPSAGEAEIVHRAIRARGTVLELGCGAGRIAEPLARLGHGVTGVDDSVEMLRHLDLARAVVAKIEGVDLGEAYDAVVLASTLINTYDVEQRSAFLAAARRHLAVGGPLVVQRHPPGYRPVEGATWQSGPVRLQLVNVVDHGGRVFSATVVHQLADIVAEQDFSFRVLDDQALGQILRDAGFGRMQALTVDGRWVAATREQVPA